MVMESGRWIRTGYERTKGEEDGEGGGGGGEACVPGAMSCPYLGVYLIWDRGGFSALCVLCMNWDGREWLRERWGRGKGQVGKIAVLTADQS